MTVQFFFLSNTIKLQSRTALKEFIPKVFRKHGRKLKGLNYIFCSDEHLLNINRQYLKHDYYTDIITFDLSATTQEIEGEIYISADRVRENAKKLEVTIKEELHRVIFHGALHLCGYKDKTDAQAAEMRRLEGNLLDQYFGR